jgi:hypothetical protein
VAAGVVAADLEHGDASAKGVGITFAGRDVQAFFASHRKYLAKIRRPEHYASAWPTWRSRCTRRARQSFLQAGEETVAVAWWPRATSPTAVRRSP